MFDDYLWKSYRTTFSNVKYQDTRGVPYNRLTLYPNREVRNLLNFPLGKDLMFVDLGTSALVEVEKMKCEVFYLKIK